MEHMKQAGESKYAKSGRGSAGFSSAEEVQTAWVGKHRVVPSNGLGSESTGWYQAVPSNAIGNRQCNRQCNTIGDTIGNIYIYMAVSILFGCLRMGAGGTPALLFASLCRICRRADAAFFAGMCHFFRRLYTSFFAGNSQYLTLSTIYI